MASSILVGLGLLTGLLVVVRLALESDYPARRGGIEPRQSDAVGLESNASMGDMVSINESLSYDDPAADQPATMTSNGVPLPAGINPAADGLPVVNLSQGNYVGMTIDQNTHAMPCSHENSGFCTHHQQQQQQQQRTPFRIHSWRGVPFAQSTANGNRFKPPVALSAVGQRGKVYGALGPGQRCCNFATDAVLGGEDCLNLDIYVPVVQDGDEMGMGESRISLGNISSNGRSSLMPVALYVHGGSFNGGTGSERNMASFVAWSQTPIVGISVNYRVGALGFLPSTFMAKRGLLNLGLRDQMAAFEWVRKNVHHFGGDKDRVTIMGLSAGAHSVGAFPHNFVIRIWEMVGILLC